MNNKQNFREGTQRKGHKLDVSWEEAVGLSHQLGLGNWHPKLPQEARRIIILRARGVS